ncbi:type I 3-dehydroquinate dehydratase [Thalassoglobus sp. JC818]|uniref:type I 3-dehydroquinate dehydratase n=1 Tax=Thalassoglobus sp. JC818 TaxID=3232136 RepID=UPI003458A26B
MICITVTPSSRTLAKADLLNAARHGDIIELCLDHFSKDPDIEDLISAVDKPIVVSCRRKQDGGQWEGTEEDRLLLLRRAIAAGPAYIELDLDIANDVPRFGSTQRVISFTRLDRPETDIDRIFDDAANARADIVKFTWPTPTLGAAWPLLVAVSQKRRLPVVGMGLGRPELTFSLLGLRYGSPWIYAALEKGMEAHDGQATVFELNDTYHASDIDSKTRFIAVSGFGESQTLTTRVLNAAFKELDMNVRCLPIELEDVSDLKRMLDILKIRAIIVGNQHGSAILDLADHVDAHDSESGYLNLLLKRDNGWHGYNTLWRSGLKALESVISETGKSLSKMNLLVIGNGGIADSIVYALTRREGMVSVCGPKDKLAQQTAQKNSCRFVPYQNLYETLADVIIIADPNISMGSQHGQINPSVIKADMTMLDVSDLPFETEFMAEARERGAHTINTAGIYTQLLEAQFKAISGKDLPESAFLKGLSES